MAGQFPRPASPGADPSGVPHAAVPGALLPAPRGAARSSYTAEQIAEAKRLWNVERLSSLAIARRLDMSKNAVIGYAHRQGWTKRSSPIGPASLSPKRGGGRPASPVTYDLDAALARWREGESSASIARSLDISADAFEWQVRCAKARGVDMTRSARPVAKPSPVRAALREVAPARYVPVKIASIAPVIQFFDWDAIHALPANRCQWIEADPKISPLRCGGETVQGCSWCLEHAARVFVIGGGEAA